MPKKAGWSYPVAGGLAGAALNIVGGQIPPLIGWALLAISAIWAACLLIRDRGRRVLPVTGVIVSFLSLVGFLIWYHFDAQASKEELHETQPAPPKPSDIQLLERAVDAVRGCRAFQQQRAQRMQEVMERIRQHDLQPHVTQESKYAFANHQMKPVMAEDMRLYRQYYKDEFMAVRRLLVMKVPVVPTATGVDYEDPPNMGGVTGICFDLSEITATYIDSLYREGRVTPEDARRYLAQIRPGNTK